PLDLECGLARRLGLAEARLGDAAAASKSLARAHRAANALHDPYERALVDLADAEAALTLGRTSAALALLASAVGPLPALGEHAVRARALVAWADLRVEEAEGRRLLVRAAASFAECGATEELRAVEARLFGGAPGTTALPAPVEQGDTGSQRFPLAGR